MFTFREYTNNLNENIIQYKQQKDLNNKFFASYTKFSAYHSSILTNKANGEQFSYLLKEYQKQNNPITLKILKTNIFKKDPLLLVKQDDLKDYYSRDNRKTLLHDYDKDKSIITMNHLERIAFEKLKQHEKKSPRGDNEYKLVRRKVKRKREIIETSFDREKVKLNKEIQQKKDEISFLNQLINNQDTIYECIHKDLTKQVFYIPKANQQGIFPYCLNKAENYKTKKIMTTQNSNVTQYSNNKKLNKNEPRKDITLSSSFYSLGKNTSPIIEKDINSNRNSIFDCLSPIYRRETSFNKSLQGNSIFQKSLSIPCLNKNLFSYSIPNSPRIILRDEELKRKEIQCLYNRVKRINIFNRNKDASDVIKRLSYHFKEPSLSTNNMKTILNSFSIIKENVERNKIPSTMKKMYQSKIPIRTARQLEKLQEIDSNLSISTEKVVKYVIGSHL